MLADGELEPLQQAQLKGHLANCDHCAAILNEVSALQDMLASSFRDCKPVDLSAAIMVQVMPDRRRGFQWLWAAAVIVILLSFQLIGKHQTNPERSVPIAVKPMMVAKPERTAQIPGKRTARIPVRRIARHHKRFVAAKAHAPAKTAHIRKIESNYSLLKSPEVVESVKVTVEYQDTMATTDVRGNYLAGPGTIMRPDEFGRAPKVKEIALESSTGIERTFYRVITEQDNDSM